jgi:hypothetical protein
LNCLSPSYSDPREVRGSRNHEKHGISPTFDYLLCAATGNLIMRCLRIFWE